jgi:hypothetical protein
MLLPWMSGSMERVRDRARRVPSGIVFEQPPRKTKPQSTGS